MGGGGVGVEALDLAGLGGEGFAQSGAVAVEESEGDGEARGDAPTRPGEEGAAGGTPGRGCFLGEDGAAAAEGGDGGMRLGLGLGLGGWRETIFFSRATCWMRRWRAAAGGDWRSTVAA